MDIGYARSALVREARSLITDAVGAITASKEQSRRTRALLQASHKHLRWSDDLIGESQRVVEELQKAVTAIGRTERASNVAPEKVLTLLRSLVTDAEINDLEPAQARSLAEDVLRWGIEGYYAA